MKNASVLLWATVGTGRDTDIPNIGARSDYVFYCAATFAGIPWNALSPHVSVSVRSTYDQRSRGASKYLLVLPFDVHPLQWKHQSSALLAFVRGIHRWPVNSPHKGPVTGKIFPFYDFIMLRCSLVSIFHHYNIWSFFLTTVPFLIYGRYSIFELHPDCLLHCKHAFKTYEYPDIR